MRLVLRTKFFGLVLATIFFSTAAAAAQKSELRGSWSLIELRSGGAAIVLEVKPRGDRTLGISFADSSFALIAPCNSMSAKFEAREDGAFTPGIISGTEMACGDDLMKVESALAAAMQRVTKFSFGQGILTIRDDAGTNVLKFSRPDPATPTETKELTLYVAPQQVNCLTVAPMKCLRTKENANGEWRLFYDPIEGFEFKKGFYYILKVRRARIPYPPKDTSSFRWELIEIVRKTKKFAKT